MEGNAPGRARTCGLQLRRLPLYPAELRARILKIKSHNRTQYMALQCCISNQPRAVNIAAQLGFGIWNGPRLFVREHRNAPLKPVRAARRDA